MTEQTNLAIEEAAIQSAYDAGFEAAVNDVLDILDGAEMDPDDYDHLSLLVEGLLEQE